MIRKSNEQTLKQVIEELISTYRLDGKLSETRLLNSWEQTVGKLVAKHTKRLYIKNKILFVELDSAAIREELSYARQKLIQRLNQVAGKQVIEDVVLR